MSEHPLDDYPASLKPRRFAHAEDSVVIIQKQTMDLG